MFELDVDVSKENVTPTGTYDYRKHIAKLVFPTAPRTDELTPKEALIAGLEACPASMEPVVLYGCGALCPVHRQHVSNLERAKELLESTRAQVVVGGYLASTNDLYVRRKYEEQGRGSSFLPHAERCGLMRLALEDHEYLRVDAWDGEHQDSLVEFWAAQESLQAHLDDWCDRTRRRRCRVISVHGSDLVNKCGVVHLFPERNLDCVVVERPGAPIRDARNVRSRFPVLPASETGATSSTDAQRLLRSRAKDAHLALAKVLHPKVEARLRDLWGAPLAPPPGADE